MDNIVQRFSENVQDAAPESDATPADGAKSKSAKAWEERFDDADFVADMYIDRHSHYVLSCEFDGAPSGLVALNDPALTGKRPPQRGALSVVGLVSHPLSQGVGGALVEAAATISQIRGYSGDLLLAPIGDASRAFYLAVGFVPDGDKLRLTPSAPENQHLWTGDDGQWRLRKYLEKPIAATKQDLTDARP
ncbi:hypothetical protein HLB44_12560 [Aquincola sp. S2]|uniref:N-acetyltransferase domain-containing protein n=1 Tax=Pseudaquabacterium terrae TaxID=2732868 RepID=A0ABX2EGR4_9BURK|nr:GNAT family N-acetyltransferase [Aquabacterium terrae]NRF67817.1 hypothetical protein [Aquabacterium terrae]